MSTPAPENLNPYAEAILNDGYGRMPGLSDEWADLVVLLNEGVYALDELAEATGIKRRTVKGLLYHGRRLGKIRMVDTRRQVEVAPDLFMVRTVRAYRAR
ncbi:hypothetical protein [Microbacterium sp. A84]|uniref:hypothetical protein n=1 Tax=Microbacterium sp. A84 TaxID=3450715 RepID=UPI003F436496